MNPKFTYSDETSHKVFMNDPKEQKEMINKLVKVNYASSSIEGTLYTIDPVSQMAAIVVKNEDTGFVDMHLILGPHIESIEVIGPSDLTVPNDFFDKTTKTITEEEKVFRCDRLMNWLQANMIPIEKEGDVLKLKDVLTIHPPYDFSNCISKNVIILEKIQNLMSAMNVT